jgi:pyruvate kinase
LAAQVQPIILKTGDTLVVTQDLAPGHPAVYDPTGALTVPATIGCTLPEVFAQAKKGERIFFDDGKIGGMIRAVHEGSLQVEITRARPQGEKLLDEKGINLPDSDISVSALSAKDLSDLAFAARHADLVALSFVRSVDDVRSLLHHLKRLKGRALGVLLKVENQKAFELLPELILAAMRSPAAGIMIARGDLAVECGYERLAEVQEEILWVCEAAHMPVVWATQVLETLAKDGIPSRAEITDAAMAERAECVMLNKGPHILDAISLLDDILQRMEAHQSKKRAMLRRLHWWTRVREHVKPAGHVPQRQGPGDELQPYRG